MRAHMGALARRFAGTFQADIANACLSSAFKVELPIITILDVLVLVQYRCTTRRNTPPPVEGWRRCLVLNILKRLEDDQSLNKLHQSCVPSATSRVVAQLVTNHGVSSLTWRHPWGVIRHGYDIQLTASIVPEGGEETLVTHTNFKYM